MGETYLMVYDNEGNIITYIPKSDISSYTDIPTQVIEITEEKHIFYVSNNGRYKIDPITLEDVLIPIIVDTTVPIPSLSDRMDALENLMIMNM